jgi:hypothetical protein
MMCFLAKFQIMIDFHGEKILFHVEHFTICNMSYFTLLSYSPSFNSQNWNATWEPRSIAIQFPTTITIIFNE